MYFCRVHDRFIVGTGHADIKGGNNRVAHRVFSGYIDSGLKADMVNGKFIEYVENEVLKIIEEIKKTDNIL